MVSAPCSRAATNRICINILGSAVQAVMGDPLSTIWGHTDVSNYLIFSAGLATQTPMRYPNLSWGPSCALDRIYGLAGLGVVDPYAALVSGKGCQYRPISAATIANTTHIISAPRIHVLSRKL